MALWPAADQHANQPFLLLAQTSTLTGDECLTRAWHANQSCVFCLRRPALSLLVAQTRPLTEIALWFVQTSPLTREKHHMTKATHHRFQ
jgi:hypothetical protein